MNPSLTKLFPTVIKLLQEASQTPEGQEILAKTRVCPHLRK